MIARWFVECPAYTAGPFPSQESAERQSAAIARLGECQEPHVVVTR